MLANKYRPQTFSDFVGQDMITGLICQAIQQNTLSQSILLSGMHGVGKTSLARIIAKSLNCYERKQECAPCNQCKNCQLITHGTHPDVIEIDAASNTSVEHMRQVIDNSQYLPIQAKYKINIIDEVHMLSNSAFNSLLKTLEEPNEHSIFILVTTRSEKIPATIISRCQRYVFSSFDKEKISKHLQYLLQQEKVKYDIMAIDKISHAAQGSMRDALFYLEQSLYFDNSYISDNNVQNMLNMQYNQQILQLLQQIITGQKVPTLHSIRSLSCKLQPHIIIRELLKMIHQILIIAYVTTDDTEDYQHNFSQEFYNALSSLAQKISPLAGHRLWCIAWKHLQNLNQQVLPQAVLEVMVIEMMYSLHVPSAYTVAKQILQTHNPSNMHNQDPIKTKQKLNYSAQSITKPINNTPKLTDTHKDTNANPTTKISPLISKSDSSGKSPNPSIQTTDPSNSDKILPKCDKMSTMSKTLQEINQDFPQAKIEWHKKTDD